MNAKIWQFFVLAKHLVEILRFTACLQACLSVQGKAAVSLRLPALPILNLEEFSLGLKEYVHLLEEAVIRVCASYGITAGRVEKATGVWLDGDSPRARKICAIGVRSSHYVTMHGLALNVNTDLRYFSYIHPCGFRIG